MDGDVIERQRPPRKRPGLKERKFLNEPSYDRRQRRRIRTDEGRIEPERRFLILMIEDPLPLDRMVRLEVTMNELGVMPFFLCHMDVLRRKQRHADEGEHGDEGKTAPSGHCLNYQCRPTAASILSGL